MNIFKKRQTLKPYEYPQLVEYVDAVRHSYWVHTEFNFTSDIMDFKVNVTEAERELIKRAMLAIAQVEVNVKTFWGSLYAKMPKPEIGAVGFTFAESEVRHMDAYSHLVEILNLNDEFEALTEVPVIKERIDFLSGIIAKSKEEDIKDFVKSILLFSVFIENVSLFAQFLVMMSFNKHRNLFKGMSNAVEATSKEEQIHALFGIELINIIRSENPDWFTTELDKEVLDASIVSFNNEMKVVDWMYELGEPSFIPKEVVVEFIKVRMNNSLKQAGFPTIFEINQELADKTSWFDDEVMTTKHTDFFQKRSVNYNKKSKSITAQDLF